MAIARHCRLVVFCCAGWLAAATLWAQGVAANPSLPDLVKTSQRDFFIPFRVDPNGPTPVEVQLHFSSNQGASWQLYEKIDPQAGRFTFHAPADGEYWFMVRTKNPQGKLEPQRPAAPELRVLVQSVTPASPPLVESPAPQDPQPQHTAAAREPEKVAEPFPSVSQAWRPNGGSATDAFRPNGVPPAMPTEFPASGDALRQGPPQSQVYPPHQQAATETIDPGIPTSEVPRGDDHGRAPLYPSSYGPQIPGSEVNWSLDQSEAVDAEPIGAGEVIGPGMPGSRTPPRVEESLTESSEPLDGAPEGVQPRMVNSRRFELEYDVEAIGPSGIVGVELWSTVDGGASWSILGADEDNRSPIVVSVPREGLYGFRMVVETGNGLRTRQPTAGDLPELWVGVDLTPPDAQLSAVEYGTGDKSGQLLFRWEASDEQLAAHPIALAFGDSPKGPWSTIASGLPNTGEYAWRLDNRVPESIYVRLEARDAAGNIQTFIDPEPVSLVQLRPKGRILGVRPLE